MIKSEIKKDLGQILKENKVDYFILPNSDEFFSEYLPENEKRINFISGFSGSNATIIFAEKKSYFFTDGRYILQAKKQLDEQKFEIFNIAEKSVISWLKENLDKNKIIGIDPKLSSLNFVKYLEKLGSKIFFFEKNPIDEIWQDRPKINKSAAFFCNKKLVLFNSITKRQKVLQNLESDAVIITKPENLCWLLNIRAADIEFNPLLLSYAILFKNGDIELFIDKNRIKNLKNSNLKQVKITDPQFFSERIGLLKKDFNKIEIDPATTNYWLYSILKKNNFIISEKNSSIDLIKSQKNLAEINGAIKSHEIDGIAVTKFLFWLENSLENGEKIDEISAARKLLEFREENPKFLYESFAAISGFAANGAIIHYHANKETSKKLETNDNQLYLIDSGGQYFSKDFCGTTDVTRTVAIGVPTNEMKENFTRVLKGHIALAQAKFVNNTSGSQLDILARNYLWQLGLNYDHGTGHGVGSFLSVHEGPCGISKNYHQALLPGMILSNEPGFYKEGEYGIRIENLMLVTKFDEKFLQFQTLTLVPIDPKLVAFEMLNNEEKEWLRKYHEKIFTTLKDNLSNNELKWLKRITEIYAK